MTTVAWILLGLLLGAVLLGRPHGPQPHLGVAVAMSVTRTLKVHR